jgi:hypothetical protein
VFDAIKIAVANGITVVEPAGNGGVNLDNPSCGGMFDRSVRDSGAIVVGQGGGYFGDRQWAGSSFGNRVDVQGWGSGVWSTGGGWCVLPPDNPDYNRCYSTNFPGTSGAAAVVAGAVANLQGVAIKAFGAPLSPADLRELLVQTGAPQLGDTSQHIGPLPDLWSAIAQLTSVINPMVSFVPIRSSYQTTLSTSGCPADSAGKFNFNARLTNNSGSPSLSALMARVSILSNGNLLQNAYLGVGGAGSLLNVPNARYFGDGLQYPEEFALGPGQFVDVPFTLCFKSMSSFNFFVDVFGLQEVNGNNSLVQR